MIKTSKESSVTPPASNACRKAWYLRAVSRFSASVGSHRRGVDKELPLTNESYSYHAQPRTGLPAFSPWCQVVPDSLPTQDRVDPRLVRCDFSPAFKGFLLPFSEPIHRKIGSISESARLSYLLKLGWSSSIASSRISMARILPVETRGGAMASWRYNHTQV